MHCHIARQSIPPADRAGTQPAVSAIYHEVNQPLAGIVTNANAGLRWLSEDFPNLVEARETLRRIARDGNRAAQIITRIRALAKKAPPQKEQINLNGIITEVIAMARNEIQGNGVSLEIRLASDLPLISGDRVQLQQVILNLLVNAIEAMCEVDEGARDLLISSELVDNHQTES
jgi:C4-dicarboxylate-specific signal transduction histidine kinase